MTASTSPSTASAPTTTRERRRPEAENRDLPLPSPASLRGWVRASAGYYAAGSSITSFTLLASCFSEKGFGRKWISASLSRRFLNESSV